MLIKVGIEPPKPLIEESSDEKSITKSEEAKLAEFHAQRER